MKIKPQDVKVGDKIKFRGCGQHDYTVLTVVKDSYGNVTGQLEGETLAFNSSWKWVRRVELLKD